MQVTYLNLGNGAKWKLLLFLITFSYPRAREVKKRNLYFLTETVQYLLLSHQSKDSKENQTDNLTDFLASHKLVTKFSSWLQVVFGKHVHCAYTLSPEFWVVKEWLCSLHWTHELHKNSSSWYYHWNPGA